MRQQRTIQASLFDLFAGHEIGRELKAMSRWLDEHPAVLGPVAEDLRRYGVKATGRQGLAAESVLRCALLKQHRQLSYEELAFHLEDSASFRAFARLPLSWTPKKSVLHKTISAIRAETWEAINRAVLGSARQEKVEAGDVIRLDSTVTDALIHEPSDSSLLWDAVRVMARMMKSAGTLAGGADIAWRDRRRAAKRRAYAIQFTRGRPRRVQQYRELIEITRAMLAYVDVAASRLERVAGPMAEVWRATLARYRPLVERIIVKGSRDTQYGHKLNLVAGRSGLILDLVIETGNPADSERFLPMLERHIAFYGRAPRQAAADGGYANGYNLQQAKARGVRDMAFHKKAGLNIEDMVKSRWVYRKLRNFRAGIEAGISCLKRAYGLARCTWRGLAHFSAYVWSSVVAYNLALFTRLRPA
jgi:IS5 family transposase